MQEVAETQGSLFERLQDVAPTADGLDFVRSYMKSDTRAFIDRGDVYLATIGPKGLMDYYQKEECPELKSGVPLKGFAPNWMGQFYARYQWQTGTLSREIIEKVIKTTVPAELLDENTKYLVNPTGRFVIGGPQGDSGLTGRKIIVDTYGGSAPHGGGAFSGKDPTKVDRSAAYAARYAAKNVVAAGLAKRCQIELAYAIGVAAPVSVLVETFGTGTVSDAVLSEAVQKVFDLRPSAIIRDLDLSRPIYRKIAAYGHMGREDLGVSWEKTDRVQALLDAVK